MATEITFSPANWEIANNCLVAVDIVANTNDQEIAATDVVIESSLAFVDFVPLETMFPYFLPPKVSDTTVHLVGFTIDPAHRAQWSGIIGTLYMQQRTPSDTDGMIKLYFKKKWDTTDSNLSIAWGIDVLDTVWSAYFTFSASGACVHAAGNTIDGWIANKSVKTLLAKLDRAQLLQRMFSRKTISLFGGICSIILILLLYYTGTKKWKQN